MTFDGIYMRSISNELKVLKGGRVNKINQPARYDLVFNIYANKKNYKLFISAGSQYPRIHFTDMNYENPKTPQNFCMLLRKHLGGARIEDVRQYKMDRVLAIDFFAYNELGDPITKSLVIEIMGKYSNIILIEKESKKILDSIKHVAYDMSRIRQVLPGLKYQLIEDDKIDILKGDYDFKEEIRGAKENTRLDRFFYTSFTGLGPAFSREVCYQAKIDDRKKTGELKDQEIDRLSQIFDFYIEKISSCDFSPIIVTDRGKLKDFYCLPLNYLGQEMKYFPTSSEAIDYYYSKTDNDSRLDQKKNHLKKFLKQKIRSEQNKLLYLKEDYRKTEDREDYKIKGDILASNVNNIKKGQKSIELENFYDENKTINIDLDVKKNPWENVEAYYKRHKKLNTARKYLEREIPDLKDEIFYMNQVLDSLDNISKLKDYDEIEEELENSGIKKPTKKNKGKKKKESPSSPLHYVSSTGADIFVGKNNAQNDKLTLKEAKRGDLFIHAKDIPGSHVILKSPSSNHDRDSIIEACYLAAIHSKNRGENYVDVDYTDKKNVRKEKGAKPGMVYYDNFKTIRIDTREDFTNRIKEIKA